MNLGYTEFHADKKLGVIIDKTKIKRLTHKKRYGRVTEPFKACLSQTSAENTR